MTELDPKLVARFENWLLAHGYSSRTIKKYTRDLVSCAKYGGKPPKAKKPRQRIIDYKLACDVFISAELGKLPFDPPTVPPAPRFGGKKSREPKRVYEAVSYPREEYDRILAAAAKAATIPSLVVVIIARTGLRVSDVLRAELGVLRAGAKRSDGIVHLTLKGGEVRSFTIKGGGAAGNAWSALLEHPVVRKAPGTWHVAAAMCGHADADPEAQGQAYERVRQTLRVIGEHVGASGRVHLHRFRRTIGVYLASNGATVDQIQKAFGQKAGSAATKRYIDEARSLESARLLRGIE